MEKQIINVFIASSNTLLSEDREHFTRIFEDINTNILPHLKFEPRRWKENLQGGSFTGINVQDEIDIKLFDICEIVFVIVYSIIGKYTKYEFNRALRDGKKVFVYFKKGFSPSDAKSAEEYAEVFRFKEQAQCQGVIISEYGTKDDLQKEVQKDIVLFSRDRYPIEDQAIVKMFYSIRETLTEEQLNEVKYFLILPNGYYTPKDIFDWFGLTTSERSSTRQVFSLLSDKGILNEKDGGFALHPVVKGLLEQKAWENYSECIPKIINVFKKNIDNFLPGQDVSYYQIKIKIIEDFVKSKVFKSAKGTFELRKSLGEYYLNSGLPRYIAKAEKIFDTFEDDNLDINENIDYATCLANIYYHMYLLMRNEEHELYAGEGKFYLNKSKLLFDNLGEVTLHSMSYASVLKMLIRLGKGDDFKSLKDDFEKLWSDFDGQYFTSDNKYNINVLEKYLELAINLDANGLLIEKIYEYLLKKQEEVTGVMSDGYLSRSIQFCKYLVHENNRIHLKTILNQIRQPIQQRFKNAEKINVELQTAYVELISSVGMEV